MALIDKLQDSVFGLKGVTPALRAGATKQSPIHAFDPTPGSQGDEIYNMKSDLDLDGKKPATYRDNAPEGASF